MFTNTLYFIVVFALFAFYKQDNDPVLGTYQTACGILAGYALFFTVVKRLFVRLEKSMQSGTITAVNNRHTSLINRCMLFAVSGWAVFIYGLEVKDLLFSLPLFANSDFLQSLTAVTMFFVFLLIIWFCAYPTYKRFFNPTETISAYIRSQVRFNSSLIAPWLIFSAVLDAAQLLPKSILDLLQAYVPVQYGLMAALFIVLAIFFPPLLIRLWACKPLNPGPVRDRLKNFCEKAGFSYADMLQWNLFEGKLLTAGVLGFVSRFRYLLLSPTLLELLDEQELEAVVAHEIGHVKRHHLLFYLLFILGYTFFAYIFFSFLFYLLLSNDFLFNLVITPDGRLGSTASFGSILMLIGMLLLYFRFLFGMFSRNFERQADAYSYSYTGSGGGIIASLEKIARAGSLSRTAPNWHHFSIKQRIDFIQCCESNPQLVKKHDRKVRWLVAGYCGICLLLGVLYAGPGEGVMNDHELIVLQKITQRRIDADPDNPLLYFMLANISFEKKDYALAISGYQTALQLAPENAEVLNNLAWLYATAQDPSWRNPPEALRLSRRAAELDPKPHILDTLAESYFQNGDCLSALATIQLAIAQKPPDLPYFERQKAKFQKQLLKQKEEIPEGRLPLLPDSPGISI